jgi:hypothetical protein
MSFCANPDLWANSLWSVKSYGPYRQLHMQAHLTAINLALTLLVLRNLDQHESLARVW